MFTCQTLLKHKYTDNVTDSVFFILWNTPFFLVSVLDSKGIINTLKRYYVAMECADLVAIHFRYMRNKIRLIFAMPEATIMNLFAFASISCGLRQMK